MASQALVVSLALIQAILDIVVILDIQAQEVTVILDIQDTQGIAVLMVAMVRLGTLVSPAQMEQAELQGILAIAVLMVAMARLDIQVIVALMVAMARLDIQAIVVIQEQQVAQELHFQM